MYEDECEYGMDLNDAEQWELDQLAQDHEGEELEELEDEDYEDKANRMERNRENAGIYDCDFPYDNDCDCIHDC